MKTLAIVGSGIAGMACGHFLHPSYDLIVYEKNDSAGGHPHTVVVPEEERSIPIDMGFMAYNETTYPVLTQLFYALQIPTQPSSMSFSVQHLPSGLEFSNAGWSGLFAQRRNLMSPRFWKLRREIKRFHREAPWLLENSEQPEITLWAYAKQNRYSREFLERYLIPMSSAVWSTEAEAMLSFPAVTLIRFFKNHGFLGLQKPHPWRTVTGGSRVVRDKIIQPFRGRLCLNRGAVRVIRRPGAVQVMDQTGAAQSFDHVILACHADEALALLEDATPQEREVLSAFRYQKNRATLHTDESVMPETRRAWASLNYRAVIGGNGLPAASTTYWMNRLQNVSDKKNYFVTINDPGAIEPEKILHTLDDSHPVYSVEAIRAQKELPELNENGRVFFCGSYFRHGFQEDALQSALDVCKRLGAAIA